MVLLDKKRVPHGKSLTHRVTDSHVSLVSSCCRMMNDQDNLDISDHEEKDSSEKLPEDISVMNDQDSLHISDHEEKDSMPSEDISEEDKNLTVAEVYNYLVSKQL